MSDRPLQNFMDIRDCAFGVADTCGGSTFQERDQLCVLTTHSNTLLSLPGKVYSKVLERRVRLVFDPQIQEEQCCFHPVLGKLNQLYILKRVLEGAW